jgi:hypothetical protein
MACRLYFWLPCLAAVALSACGGSETDFFSDGHGGGSSRAGAPSHAGSTSNSSAGKSNSGGNPGTAGTVSVAGSTSSAGNVGSGGDGSTGVSGSAGAPGGGTSSGGRAGSNGSGGAGGRTGSAGSGATAGRAGSAGTGGSIEDLSCNELHELAKQQLEDARACNLAASSLQCNATVQDTCDCLVPVRREDSAETKAYLATMKKVKDSDCSWFCTKAVCPQVTDAECKTSGSASKGVCTAVSNGPGHGSF